MLFRSVDGRTLFPVADGDTAVHVAVDDQKVSVPVHVARAGLVPDLSFRLDGMPIFMRNGCNSGGCHGKASGQNGFKLSLLGFEPLEDYDYLVKEARGRRLFAASPENSLLLRKAIGTAPHGGGKKIEGDSPFYRVLLRWVQQGAPFGTLEGGAVTKIEVFPKERFLERGGKQQLLVLARHADGSTTDVTRMTQFETNAAELAEVSATGLVASKQIPGTAAIMVRYQSHVDVFRATVPLGAAVANMPAPGNFIDKFVFERLKQLGVPLSDSCDDSTFIRRATLDISGRLPTMAETKDFLEDKANDKREKLIDRLLSSADHAEYFALKWGAVLRNRRKATTDDPKPTQAFHDWIRDSVAKNKPYDQFVREVLTATGAEVETPPVVWFREVKDSTTAMEDAAQLFLGQRVGAARTPAVRAEDAPRHLQQAQLGQHQRR